MYADDMLLLSKTESGLQKSLDILEEYCKKWRLVVNIKKTKIMIFNKRVKNEDIFKYGTETLEITSTYTYLGVKISRSGSFRPAIDQLCLAAKRGLFKIRSNLNNYRFKPKVMIKLFDVLIKPILLYASEVWGGFGIRKKNDCDIVKQLLMLETSPYEKINVKTMKFALRLHSRTSNFGCRAELGRLPLIISILNGVLKFYVRLRDFPQDSLMFHAYQSQSIASVNSNSTMTYNNICKIVLQHMHTNIHNLPTQSSKLSRKSLGRKLEISLKCKYISDVFLEKMSEITNDPGSKLSIYGRIKTKFEYENYLNHDQFETLTKIRLSSHWFPIETGRYSRPIIPREQRICKLCNNNNIGDETHCMLKCKNEKIVNIKRTLFTNIQKISPPSFVIE